MDLNNNTTTRFEDATRALIILKNRIENEMKTNQK
jgi:hypothetical protein